MQFTSYNVTMTSQPDVMHVSCHIVPVSCLVVHVGVPAVMSSGVDLFYSYDMK